MNTYMDTWYKYATIRHKPRIKIDAELNLPFFPEELQPLCNHPLVHAISKSAKQQVLLQSCYKFLQEVCITETDIVNPTCLQIAYGSAPIQLSEELKLNAFSIIADEAFHSCIARDLMLQIKNLTGIEPINFTRENELTKAIQEVLNDLPEHQHSAFKLFAACVSENIFTDEIIKVSRFDQVHSSFHQATVDHAKDEGRHANYFVKIMSLYWEQASQVDKETLRKIIPKFIHLCMNGNHEQNFTRQLLQHIGMTESNIAICFKELINKTLRESIEIRLKNILKFFKKSGISLNA